MTRFITAQARFFALLGGGALLAMIALICLSVAGDIAGKAVQSDVVSRFLPALSRLGIGPLTGEYELTEMLMAFAIFAFLPIAVLSRSHASVSFISDSLPKRMQSVLQSAIDCVFAVACIVIAWKLYEGTLSKYSSGTTTFLLRIPLWWSYAAALCGAISAACVAVYIALAGLRLNGRPT